MGNLVTGTFKYNIIKGNEPKRAYVLTAYKPQ